MGSVKHIILNRPDGAYFVTAYAFCDEPIIRVLAMRFQNIESQDVSSSVWLDSGNRLASWTSATGLHRRANVSGSYDLMANVRVPEPRAPLARDRVYYKDYKFWVDRKRGPKELRNLDNLEWLLGYVSGLFSRIEFERTPITTTLPTQEIR